MSDTPSKPTVVPRNFLVPFILVTLLFPLWGFANDITNPMVAAFKNILLLSHTESYLVQSAFYGGYALMAIPAAIFIRKFSYKSGILLGLTLYALGCLLFIPSGWSQSFYPFLLAYLIMTSGLSFLETTANPYVLSMGDERTATRRLNFSQAFNPMGSIFGMFVASMFILYSLDPTSEDSRRLMRDVENGKPAHSQLVARQQQAATDLAEQLANPDLLRKRRLLMKAKNQAETTAATLAVVADPRPELARELTRKLAAQPTGSKFAESAAAVAVVFQVREPEPPTPAEAERDAAFGSAAGLELANLLATEIDALGANGALTAARPDLAAAAAAARQTADALAKAFADPTGAAEQVAAASQSVAGLSSALGAASETLGTLEPAAIKDFSSKTGEKFADIRSRDLGVVVLPYALMGFFLLGILGLFAWKLPRSSAHETSGQLHFAATLGRLVRNWRYLGGVIAQTFYVGAQIMCWTTIIQYAEGELGIPKSVAQNCNIVAMVIFVTSRFICTFLLHYIRPGALLALLAIGGLVLTLGTIFLQGYAGLYSLVGVSACMSLMFPTIYGIALDGLGDDAKLGSAGLILAIGGGCLMPQIQGMILDLPPVNLGLVELSSVRASFFLPALCFVVIAAYGLSVIGKKAAIHKLAPLT